MNSECLYTRICKFAGRFESLKRIQKPPDSLRKNIELTDLNATPEEVVALAIFGVLAGGTIACISILASLIIGIPLIVPISTLPLPIMLYFSIGWYPSWKAESERAKGLGGIPKLISYLTISLKIKPNLERAIKFSVERLEGSLGKSFRKEIWKEYIESSSGIDKVLTKFGEYWGKESKELKRSMDLIKSSVRNGDSKTRDQILEQALKTSFEGTKNKMESFAAGLKLPTTVIYGVGILLPLVLLAVLPVVSSTGLQIGGGELALIYCILLPITIYVLEKYILSKRPTAFSTPEIPSLENKQTAAVASIPIAALPPTTTYILQLHPTIQALSIIWSISLSTATFCYLSSYKTYETRKMNKELEDEFCDALTQLGSQLEGNRPAENAFRTTAETTEGSRMSEILRKTSANLEAGGMSIRSAFFDSEQGSLKDVHSKPIRHTFRMITDLLNRSTKATGEAVLHISEHMKRLRKVEEQIRRALQEVVSSMKSVALFFGPLVASVTVQLQQLLSEKTSGMPLFGSNVQISSPIFTSVLGFYVIAITILLTSYTVEIEIGNDGLTKKMELSRSLPTAIIVYTFGLLLGGQMLSILIG